jgi:hypothetical protein
MRAPAGGTRPRVPVLRRAVSEATPRRRAGRGRAGRVGCHAGGPQGAAGPGGAPGIWKAARELWPSADEQRCTVHALRNVTAKLPERHHRELKTRWWQVLDDAASPADARRGLQAIVADYRTAYPSAMAVITDNLDALVAHLRWPTEHRKRIRSTNLLERSFVEVRRRTKVIGRFPGRDQRPEPDLGRARTHQPRLARRRHDPEIRRRDQTPAPRPTARLDQGGDRRLASLPSGSYVRASTRTTGRHRAASADRLQPCSLGAANRRS